MSARQDDNFRLMLRRLATPRVVTLTDADMRKVRYAAQRRRQGLPARIRDVGVVRTVAGLIRAR
jgi:hypothetical protein